jgi:hypothetical protein
LIGESVRGKDLLARSRANTNNIRLSDRHKTMVRAIRMSRDRERLVLFEILQAELIVNIVDRKHSQLSVCYPEVCSSQYRIIVQRKLKDGKLSEIPVQLLSL